MTMTNLIELIVKANNNKNIWTLGHKESEILNDVKSINALEEGIIEIIGNNGYTVVYDKEKGWI